MKFCGLMAYAIDKHLQSHNGTLIMVVETATQHDALAAELAVYAVKEEILLLVRFPEGVLQLLGHLVMGLFRGQPELDLYLQMKGSFPTRKAVTSDKMSLCKVLRGPGAMQLLLMATFHSLPIVVLGRPTSIMRNKSSFEHFVKTGTCPEIMGFPCVEAHQSKRVILVPCLCASGRHSRPKHAGMVGQSRIPESSTAICRP